MSLPFRPTNIVKGVRRTVSLAFVPVSRVYPAGATKGVVQASAGGGGVGSGGVVATRARFREVVGSRGDCRACDACIALNARYRGRAACRESPCRIQLYAAVKDRKSTRL